MLNNPVVITEIPVLEEKIEEILMKKDLQF
jgi:hypothetical protein